MRIEIGFVAFVYLGNSSQLRAVYIEVITKWELLALVSPEPMDLSDYKTLLFSCFSPTYIDKRETTIYTLPYIPRWLRVNEFLSLVNDTRMRRIG